MEKELQMIKKTAQTDSIISCNCLFDSISFQNASTNKNGFVSFDKLVNAGGSDEMDVQGTSCYLRFTEGVTLFGWGKQQPKTW